MTEYLQYFPKPFLEDVIQSRCLPFIGAGFSLNALTPVGVTMPDWDALGRQVAAALPVYQYTTALEALSAYSHEYSRAKLVETLSSSLLLSSAQPGPAHEAFCQLPFDRVITTNFDFLLERTYAALSRYCLPLIAEDQLAVGFGQAGVRLLKLHGDLHHPNRMIVTEDDYDSLLSRYPLFATHLSSLLIESTGLFVGYSLDDPDFRQIWQIVKDRLGQLRRPAYTIQVGVAAHVAARYERRGVKVINLPSSPSRSYGAVLESAFRELREYWTGQLLARSTATETEPQAELSMPTDARGRMCFFSVPTRLAGFYKTVAYPIAERFGFSPIMATDVVTPGDSIMAKTFALIEKATIVVADVSTPNTLLEVGRLLSKPPHEQRLVIITERGTPVPVELSRFQTIQRSEKAAEGDEQLVAALTSWFSQWGSDLLSAFDDEPRRLIEKKEYRAGAIAAFTVLEHELRISLSFVRSDQDIFSARLSLAQMLDAATKAGLLKPQERNSLLQYQRMRNELVHTGAKILPASARKLVDDIQELVRRLRNIRTRLSLDTQ